MTLKKYLGMKQTLLVVGILALTGILGGCPVDDVNDRLKALEQESAKWREVADTTSRLAVRAVPGERYLELIDDIYGDDAVKKKKAQQFLQRLGDFDPSIQWEAMVSYGFDEAKPLHSDIFLAIGPTRLLVEQYVPYTFNANQSVTNTLSLPTSFSDVNNLIDADVEAIVMALTGAPSTDSFNHGVPGEMDSFVTLALSWPHSVMPLFSARDSERDALQKKIKEAKENQDKIRTSLKEALKAQYEKKAIPTGGLTLSRPWLASDRKDYIFVLIPDDDYQAHKNDRSFLIEAVLHKKGEPTATLNDTRPITFNIAEFENNPPVERPFKQGKVRWAVKNITGDTPYLPDDLNHARRRRDCCARSAQQFVYGHPAERV